MPAHFLPTPPVTSDDPTALARWEDDGGPAYEPRLRLSDLHWMRIGAALTTRLPELAGREDIIVTCKPGTQSGAPAAFFQTTAQLEVDANLFAPIHPANIRPHRIGDEENYPTAWGAFTHEAAHAAHSKWITPPDLFGTAQGDAAEILEESRAEKAHLTRRPDDRHWLRAVASNLIMEDFTPDTVTDTWGAATAAGLILARRDAGILTHEETEPLAEAVTRVLGEDTLATLTSIWKAAHATGDDDQQSMLAHAEAWCNALDTQPASPPSLPGQNGQGGAQDSESGQDGQPGTRGELAVAISQVTSMIDVNNTVDQAARARKRAKAAQAAQARQAANTAEKVFTPGAGPYLPKGRKGTGRGKTSPVTGTRPPTPSEKSAAGQLARALRAAAYRERTVTVTASAAPPGRLSMRGALARDAQRAAGAVPTAQPWIRTHRRQGATPPLRVGIAVDVSGSMSAATAPIASAAWIVAKAAALTDPDSRTATIAYGATLTAITAPGKVPAQVTEFDANQGSHSLAETIDALNAGLDLTTPGTGRLLVIASDGYYYPHEALAAAERVTALRAAGCALLWLAFDSDPQPLPGTTLLTLTDPAQAATAIAQAATTALATT